VNLAKALKEGKGLLFIENLENGKVATYSKTLMCTTTGISYEEPSPNTFSFNSPYGACPYCKGLGVVKEPDLLKIIPDKTKNIIDGAIVPLGEYKDNYTFKLIKQILTAYKQNINHPIEKISKEAMDFILFGSEEKVDVNLDFDKKNKSYAIQFDGVVNQIKKSLEDSSSDALAKLGRKLCE
jgi:excinuclease ABC subunit A